MTPQQQARLDFEQARNEGGLALALPNKLLFNSEEFFNYYRDPIVDRERDRTLYIQRKSGTRVFKTRPKRK